MKKELRGDFEQIVVWSFLDPAQVNAAALKKAMKGAGTDEQMLIDVICTSNNQDIQQIKAAFKECKLFVLIKNQFKHSSMRLYLYPSKRVFSV